MIDIFDISGKKIESGEVLSDLLITSSCQHVEELMKSNYVQLSWNDAQKYTLPVGSYIVPFPNERNPYTSQDARYPIKYRLFEPYIAEAKHETNYVYEPQFQHPIIWLSYLPLMLVTGNVSNWNDAIKKTTWGYTGTPRQIAAFIVDCINWLSKHLPAFGDVMGDGWTACVDTDLAPTVTVNFESTSIMGGASQIASACDCEFHFDYAQKQFRLGIIRYGEEFEMITGVNVGVASVSRTKKDYHNAFLVKGSTRNLSQPTDGGENMQVTERLTLDPTKYPDSIIYTDPDGKFLSRDEFLALGMPSLIEELVFDDIYPKLELYLYNVRERKCWKLDSETGNKVEDEDGEEDTDGKKYKTYSKWYFRLAYPIYITDSDGNRTVSRWVAYKLSDKNIIEGQTAQITFLPNYESDAKPSLMLGQGDFDVVYFDKQTQEKGEDDINANGFTALEGDYRIVFKEDNNVIIPTTSKGGIFPQGEITPSLKGNKATLINVVVDEAYKEQARLDLEMVAKRKVSLLRSDLNNYELSSNPVYFEENNPQLHLGQAVIYDDGQRFNDGISYRLSTHIIKIVTQLDYPFVKEITIGNEKVKGDISTLKEQVKTMVTTLSGDSGSGVYVIGLNDFTPATDSNVYSARRSRMEFLSKTEDGTAKSTITWEKVQKFIGGLLVGKYNSENGGSWSLDSVGRSHLVTDYLEVRMKAIFEELVIKKTSAIGGKEIISPAGGVKIHKVEVVSVTYNATEQKAYRCYFLAEQEGDAVDNDFAIDDQVRSESFNLKSGAYHKAGNHFYWRLIIGRDENPVELEGIRYHYIDLSDSDCATDSDIPAIGDTLSQCGNRSDIARQNCLIFSSVDVYSPSVSLYHGINSYSFANKEYVEYGVNKQTDKAFFNVYGDLYIGDRPTKENGNEGASYIKFDSAKKQMEIKARISAKSNVDDKLLPQYIRDNSLSVEDVKELINNSEIIDSLQNQIDGAIETWYYEGKPTLKNLPAQNWTDDETKNKHIGDLYYDKASGKAYRFLKDATGTYMWVLITDEDITKALALAGEKKRIFGTTPTPPYDVNDLWVYAVYPSDGSKYNKEILRCVTAKSAGEKFSIDDWALASDYATNTKVAQLDYLKDALKNDTVVDGGLILSTLIALRDKSKNIQSGINGAVQDAKYKGGGIAAWYGGEMGDIEDKSNYPGVTNWAKSLLRFDGSGYLANGNITWGSEGKVSIKDLSALINTDNTDILNVLSSISSMFSTRVKESETLILPQLRFGELFINRLNTADTNLNNNDVVLTQGELKDRFVTIDWFNKVFSVVDDKKSDLPVNGNISSGASIHAKMSLWSDGGLSALGNSDVAGGGGGGLMGTIVPYAKAIALTTQNEGAEIASAWSVKMLYDKIETIDVSGQLTSYLTKQEAQTLYQPVGNYLTAHQDISGKADRSELLGYLPLTGGTLTGTLTANKGLVVQGRVYGKGDDEGIIINASDNGFAGVILGSHDSNRGILYFNKNTNQYFLRTVLNGVTESVLIPYQSGTMALTSQIPTNNNQLTNGAGYITSSGSCAYATNADTVDGVHVLYTGSIPDSNWLAAWENATTIRCLSPKSLKLSKFDDDILSGKYLPLSGGTLTGNLDLGSNTLFAKDISLEAEGINWNFSNGNKIKLLSWNGSAEATGAPGKWQSGVSFMTHYVGFQLLSYGGDNEALLFRKMQDNGVWHSWHNIYHEGHKPTKADVGLGNVDNTADVNKSVSYAATSGVANSVAWGNVSGRPTRLSDFIDDVVSGKYLPLTGGIMTGPLRVDYYILGYNYNHAGKNAPAFVFDKPGSYMTGIGANGEADTIYFSCATTNGIEASWITSYKQKWKFNGTIYQEDNAVIHAGNIGSQSVNYAATSGVANAVAWSGVTGKPTTLSGYGITDGLYSTQVRKTQTNITWFEDIIKTNRRAFIYNPAGDEYSYLIGMSLADSDSPQQGTILKMGYADRYLRILRRIGGTWLTNDWEKISAGFADSADKLQTARTIWGQRFDGTSNVDGNLSCNGQGSFNSLQIGNITIIYDAANKGLRIAGGGLYTDSYLSSLGVDASTALSVKKWADSIQITTESDSELATAYSIGNLYRLINSNQKTITESLNQSVGALQGRCTSLEQRVSALEKKVNK